LPRRRDRRLHGGVRLERVPRHQVLVRVVLARVDHLCVDEVLTQLDELEPLLPLLPRALPTAHEPLDEARGVGLAQCAAELCANLGRAARLPRPIWMSSASAAWWRDLLVGGAACAAQREALGLGRGGALAQREPLPRWRCGALRAVARALSVLALDDRSGVVGLLIQDHAFNKTAFGGRFAQVEAPFSGRGALRAIPWALAVAALDHGRSGGLLNLSANEVSR